MLQFGIHNIYPDSIYFIHGKYPIHSIYSIYGIYGIKRYITERYELKALLHYLMKLLDQVKNYI